VKLGVALSDAISNDFIIEALFKNEEELELFPLLNSLFAIIYSKSSILEFPAQFSFS
jgi:hypothetical protein